MHRAGTSWACQTDLSSKAGFAQVKTIVNVTPSLLSTVGPGCTSMPG